MNAVNVEALAKYLRAQNVSVEDEALVWRLLWTAIGTWLKHDLERYKAAQVEAFFKSDDTPPMLGYLDLVLDDALIVDWKVFGSEPDAWKRRLTYGVQGGVYRRYGQQTKHGVMFRGIHRKTLKCYETQITEEGIFQDVIDQMLIADATHHWRRRSEGCWAFKRKCPYFAGCLGETKDPHPPENDPETLIAHFSSHSIEEFLLCPQRYRRRRLVEIQGVPTGTEYDEEDSADARTGSLFHMLIAIVYGVSFGILTLPTRGAEKTLSLDQFRRIK